MTHSDLPGPLSIGLACSTSYFVTTNEKIREYLFFFAKDEIIYNIPTDKNEMYPIMFTIAIILLIGHMMAKNGFMFSINAIVFQTVFLMIIISITLFLFEYNNYITFENGFWLKPNGVSFENIDSLSISIIFSFYVILFTLISRPLDQIDPFSFKMRRERPFRRRRSFWNSFRDMIGEIRTDPLEENWRRVNAELNQEEPSEDPPAGPESPSELEESEKQEPEPEQIEKKEKSRAEIVLERMKGEES